MTRKVQKISGAVRKKLEQARVARLATLDAQGVPHIVPICFVFVYHNRVFYTAIDLKPKRVEPRRLARLKHIQAAPQVALLVDKYDDDNWSQLWYVLARGRATLVPDSAKRERAAAIRRLRAKYPQYAAGMLADNAILIRIKPEQIISWGNI
jgi:PPOX class probable F420-dependent enzyme